jgi:hypothetical protein
VLVKNIQNSYLLKYKELMIGCEMHRPDESKVDECLGRITDHGLEQLRTAHGVEQLCVKEKLCKTGELAVALVNYTKLKAEEEAFKWQRPSYPIPDIVNITV